MTVLAGRSSQVGAFALTAIVAVVWVAEMRAVGSRKVMLADYVRINVGRSNARRSRPGVDYVLQFNHFISP